MGIGGESFPVDGDDNGSENPVPKPATMLLLGLALIGIARARRGFKK